MTNSWKIGAVSGLIASFFGGLLFLFLTPISFSLGFFTPLWREPLTRGGPITFVLLLIWGVIFGLIYSKTYNLIPKKGIFKGFIYGFILYVLVTVRMSWSFSLVYGYVLDANSWAFLYLFFWVLYGLVLGFFYEYLCRRYCPTRDEPKIIAYDMKGGILPGAIAGLFAGIAAGIVAAGGPVIGLWQTAGVPQVMTFDFLISQVQTHIVLNMFWGVIFGALYAIVYNLVPGKGVTKGLVYSMILWILFAFIHWSFNLSWFVFIDNWPLVMYYLGVIAIGIAHNIVFGLVLGYLYRKPGD